MKTCPCGSKRPYKQCCRPIHQAHAQAKLPAQLMRARYSAYVMGLNDFIFATYHPSCQTPTLGEQLASGPSQTWLKLIVEATASGRHADEAFVQFQAHYRQGDDTYILHERSRFLRELGLWYYIDGEFISR